MLLPAHHALGQHASGSGIIASTGGAVGSTLMTIGSPAIASALGITGLAAAAIPIAGVAIAAVTTILAALGVGSGCGQTCVVASNNANQIEAQMKANLAAFQSGQLDQATALANFDALWAAFVNMCGQVGGDQAHNCVSDRQQGACKWHDSSGQCWNWFTGYRDPISNAAAAPTATLTSLAGNFNIEEWVLLGLVAWGIAEAVS